MSARDCMEFSSVARMLLFLWNCREHLQNQFPSSIFIKNPGEIFIYTQCIFALDIAHDLIDHMPGG